MNKTGRLAFVCVPLVLGIGLLMGQLSGSGYGNNWFDALAKPPTMPPGWAFGIAWSILYVLLGLALAVVLAAPPSRAKTVGLALFSVQLAINFAWSPLFFAMHQVALALAAIATMTILSVFAAANFARVRPLAAWLMLPYIGWLTFAAHLNYEILRLNPGA